MTLYTLYIIVIKTLINYHYPNYYYGGALMLGVGPGTWTWTSHSDKQYIHTSLLVLCFKDLQGHLDPAPSDPGSGT
jgi:hypothetical protein